MADISGELARIMSAVRGEDVRYAIYEALNKMNAQLNAYLPGEVAVTGVKGSTESEFRAGQVEISAAQVGALDASYAGTITDHTNRFSSVATDIYNLQLTDNRLTNRLGDALSAIEDLERRVDDLELRDEPESE